MANEDDNKPTETGEGDEPESGGESLAEGSEAGESEATAPAAAQLGATRYVMAGFFTVGIAVAFVLGKLLAAIWNTLAEKAFFQQSAAVLARVGEEERVEITTVIGAAVALFTTVYVYRRPDVRQWSDDVATELSKVTWPDKTEVTNSTVVVIVASAFATLYLSLLDRFWGFVTNLVYGS